MFWVLDRNVLLLRTSEKLLAKAQSRMQGAGPSFGGGEETFPRPSAADEFLVKKKEWSPPPPEAQPLEPPVMFEFFPYSRISGLTFLALPHDEAKSMLLENETPSLGFWFNVAWFPFDFMQVFAGKGSREIIAQMVVQLVYEPFRRIVCQE